jgi:hypothetical protein
MARISTYPIDTNLSGGDKWIGTDVANQSATKNFSLESVAEWINVNATIDAQTLRYVYQSEATDANRLKGSISLPTNKAGDVSFSTITNFIISSYSLKYTSQPPPTDISGFFTTPLISSFVLITNTKDISNYGIFKWDSAATNPNKADFWDIGLTLQASSGDFKSSKDYLLSLLTYDPSAGGGDKNFVFTQAAPSATWTITHNLDKFPSVSVVNSALEVVYGNIEYNNINQLTITFSAPFAGQAFLN